MFDLHGRQFSLLPECLYVSIADFMIIVIALMENKIFLALLILNHSFLSLFQYIFNMGLIFKLFHKKFHSFSGRQKKLDVWCGVNQAHTRIFFQTTSNSQTKPKYVQQWIRAGA